MVEDTYDPGMKTHEESIVYCSPRRQPPGPVKIRKDKPMQVRRSKPVPPPRGKLAAPTVGREVPKYIIIGLVTLLAAGLVSYATIFVLQQLQAMEIEMGQGTAQAVLNNAHQYPTREIFVTLQHINIRGTPARHLV